MIARPLPRPPGSRPTSPAHTHRHHTHPPTHSKSPGPRPLPRPFKHTHTHTRGQSAQKPHPHIKSSASCLNSGPEPSRARSTSMTCGASSPDAGVSAQPTISNRKSGWAARQRLGVMTPAAGARSARRGPPHAPAAMPQPLYPAARPQLLTPDRHNHCLPAKRTSNSHPPAPPPLPPTLTCNAVRAVAHWEDTLLIVEGGVQPLHLPKLQHCKELSQAHPGSGCLRASAWPPRLPAGSMPQPSASQAPLACFGTRCVSSGVWARAPAGPHPACAG